MSLQYNTYVRLLHLCAADLPPQVAKAWLQSWKWAAITVAVVTSPVIGKVAKVAFERFAGTIAGDDTVCSCFFPACGFAVVF